MRTLVTGGAGFIGGHLVEALVNNGHEVTVLDDFSMGNDDNLEGVRNDIRVLRGDVRDEDAVGLAMRGVEVVFHQAAASSTLMFLNDLRGALRVNLDGFLNVLGAAVQVGARRVVYASSATVYGNAPLPLNESLCPQPGNFYAASKVSNEYLAAAFSRVYGVETVGLRYMGIYGPRELRKGGAASVVTQFMVMALRGQKAIVYEGGQQTRDFTYVKDVALANVLAGEHPRPLAGEVFNVGTGVRTSFNELIDSIGLALGAQIRTEYVETPYAGYQLDQLADVSKIRAMLAYKPHYSLKTALTELAEHLRQQLSMEG